MVSANAAISSRVAGTRTVCGDEAPPRSGIAATSRRRRSTGRSAPLASR